MTFKAIAMLKRRQDVSRDAFIDYYETKHAPLILSLVPGILEYRRNFADFEGAYAFPEAAPFDFDVITELWFEDRAAYDRAMAVNAEPEVAARVAADEENFLDRGKTRMFVVQERKSSIG